MKKVIFLVVLLFLLGCEEPKKTSTDISITTFDSKYECVTISYTITNTGNTDIDYYEVYFRVDTTIEIVTQCDKGSDVPVSSFLTDGIIINIGSGQVSSVTIVDTEFVSY